MGKELKLLQINIDKKLKLEKNTPWKFVLKQVGI